MNLNQSPASGSQIDRLSSLGFPREVVDFYARYDGAYAGILDDGDFLGFDNNRYCMRLVGASDMVPMTDYGFIYPGDANYEFAQNWYVVLDYADGNVLAINLNKEGYGVIIDCFHETCGVDPRPPVVHDSFGELVNMLKQASGVYWL